MRLLFITQSYEPESGVVGFIPLWVEEAKKHFSDVTVFCLRSSVKNKKIHVFKKRNVFATALKLNKLAYKYRHEYDAIFCHYSAKFALVLLPFSKLYKKNIFQWWGHGHYPMDLRCIKPFVKKFYTPSLLSIPFQANKITPTGHGINNNFFNFENTKTIKRDQEIILISIGRITPVKNYAPLIEAISHLKHTNKKIYDNLEVRLYGPTIKKEDEDYKNDLINLSRSLDVDEKFYFENEVSHDQVKTELLGTHLFINLQFAGGMGKAVLESFAMGVPTFFATPAFDDELPNEIVAHLKFDLNDTYSLSKKLLQFCELSEEKQVEIKRSLKEYTQNKHGLRFVWEKIYEDLSSHV